MGNSTTKYKIDEYSINKNLSSKYNISEWVDLETPLKNINYYFRPQSVTVIPLKFYPQYTEGYIYGVYEKSLINDYELL